MINKLKKYQKDFEMSYNRFYEENEIIKVVKFTFCMTDGISGDFSSFYDIFFEFDAWFYNKESSSNAVWDEL